MKKTVEIVGFQMAKTKKAKLKSIAEEKGISLSALLNVIISDWLKTNK